MHTYLIEKSRELIRSSPFLIVIKHHIDMSCSSRNLNLIYEGTMRSKINTDAQTSA